MSRFKKTVALTGLALAVALAPCGGKTTKPTRATSDDPNGIIIRPIPEKMVVLTFDDSCVSHATFVAPLLKKYGFGGTFYITEAFNSKQESLQKMYMSWAQIKGLEDMGFEIGNHSLLHGNFSTMGVDDCKRDMMTLEADFASKHIAKATTFAWPACQVNKGLFPVMAEKGYLFARGGRACPYDPTVDNPFDTPGIMFLDVMDRVPNYYVNFAKQATPGKFVIFCFHGVPDLGHSSVGTKPEGFEMFMKYLKDNNYTVIAMRDMAKYVDAAKAAKLLAK